jgi:hypothetical protein
MSSIFIIIDKVDSLSLLSVYTTDICADGGTDEREKGEIFGFYCIYLMPLFIRRCYSCWPPSTPRPALYRLLKILLLVLSGSSTFYSIRTKPKKGKEKRRGELLDRDDHSRASLDSFSSFFSLSWPARNFLIFHQ